MKANKHISKFVSAVTVSFLTGAAAAPALADDAGYHAEQLKQTQAQTGSLLVLGDAASVTRSGQSKSARDDRSRKDAGEGETLSESEKLWNRFERIRANGP